jgi:hypothetical protein
VVEISKELQDVLYSNLLPRADIKISIKKTGSRFTDGGEREYFEEEVVSFTGKDVLNVKFSQSVDPTGTELPLVKLTWEQNYIGDLGENYQPILDYEVKERMAVDFSIIYSFKKHFYWKKLFEDGIRWKQLFEDGISWKNLFYKNNVFEVKLKRTFLSSLPVFSNGKITWESRDLVFFLTGDVKESTKIFDKIEDITEEYYYYDSRETLIRSILLKENGRMYDANDISISRAIESFSWQPTDFGKDSLKEKQVFSDLSKEIIKNCLSPINCFVNLKKDGSFEIIDFVSVLNKYSDEPTRKISLKNQRNFPKITAGNNVSNYSFETTTYFIDYDDFYVAEPYYVKYESGEGYTVQKFLINEFSTRHGKDGKVTTEPKLETDYSVLENFNEIVYKIKGQYYTPLKLNLYKMKPQSTTTTLKVNESGLDFDERNKLNPFLELGERGYALERKNLISLYYSSQNSSVESNTFGDPSIEPLDVVSIETNLKEMKSNGEVENITKSGIVISSELVYNGYVSQKIIVHELK